MMKFTRIAKLFSVSLLEILTVEVCFSRSSHNGDYDCNGRGGESRYIVNANPLPWHLANEFCQSKNSYILVIQNEGQQNAFETYLNNCWKSFEPKIYSVWTSGKRETLANWTWINGQTLDFTRRIAPDSDTSKTHAMLHTRSMTAENPLNYAWYLCQQKDNQCNGQNQVNLTNGCVIPSENGNTTWYEARNECLSKGGDLAVLTDQDLQKLNNDTLKHPNYWIGLRKVSWIWKTNTANQEVKYTKWARQTYPTSGELCISINTADGQWTVSECNRHMSVVCAKHGQIPISSTKNSITIKSNAINTTTRKHSIAASSTATSTTTSSTKYNNVSTTSHQGQILTSKTRNSVAGKSIITKRTTTGNRSVATSTTTTITVTTTKYNNVSPTIYPDQQMSETTTRSMEEGGTPSALIIGATSVGVVIIIVCIIVIVIVLCQTSKSSNTKMEPKTDEVKLQKTKEPKPKETAEVLKNDNAPCIYADIPPAEKTPNDQPGAIQPGIVYASLEFDQGVTYAEPMKRKSQDPVDSVGPIYAEPFEAMGSQNGTTSSSGPSGQATKIGPMGDVYTLPSPNISSPSANMTSGPIYANTQT